MSPQGPDAVRRQRLIRLSLSLVGFALFTLGVLLLAPLMLILLGIVVPQSDGWQLLSNIGQSFTGISAILSALALGGVAYTSRLQAQQARIAGIQAARGAQLELVRMAMNDLNLARVVGFTDSETFEDWQAGAYRNLWFMHQQMTFRIEELSETGLRRALALELLSTPAAVEFWTKVGSTYALELTDPLGQRFIEIVDEEALSARKSQINRHDRSREGDAE